MRLLPAILTLLSTSALAAQQGPSLRNLAEMTVSIGDVRIGADEHGRSELCDKLAALRKDGFPVTPAAETEALTVLCEGRPARVLVLRVSPRVADPKRAVCEYGAAPAGLAYDGVDWVTLRRGGLPMTGEEMRNRLEPLGVRTFAALLFAFGFESIDGRRAGSSVVTAPLHQIDGFCADSAG
jgi:hypothetical protein